MGFEAPMTIKKALENIDQRRYLLPAIQREFVWKASQIEQLFDSLMRSYPIGSFLFWRVEGERTNDYQFYEFIRNYHERDQRHNTKADVSGVNEITAVLDGQQRLTALFVGLKGTYAMKLPNKRWDNDSAYPERRLHINLLKSADEGDMEYDFKFLTRDQALKRDDDHFWFKVGDVLNFSEEVDVNNYLIDHGLMSLEGERAKFANRTLFRLYTVFHKDAVINFFLEEDESLDKVLNIFIRVNSGGTQLDYSDLLLSIATAQWEKRDAREEITKFVDDINRSGRNFNINKDFILKSCLVLCDMDMKFKVDNFNHDNMLKIEDRWDDIKKAIELSFNLVASFGYNRDTLTSNNAIIPIAYFLYKNGSPTNFVDASYAKDERKRIQNWLVRSLLKKAFGGVPDNVLTPIRQIIDSNEASFPFERIVDHFRGTNRSLTFDEDDIENLFSNKYGQSFTFSTLALLYPTLDFRNLFHQDHIFAKSIFTRSKLRKLGISEDQIDIFIKLHDTIANLQLLEGTPNREKSDKDFREWLEQTYPDETTRLEYKRKHYIPDIDLNINTFDEFIAKRKDLMKARFREMLGISVITDIDQGA